MATRRWFRVHSFAGIFAGLLLFVVCWTGTFATVANEIDWLLTPAMRAEPSARLEPDALEGAALAAMPGSTLAWMSRPLHAGYAADVVVNMADGRMQHVYVRPGDAVAQGGGSYFNVQRFFRSLHMALFLPFGVGIYIVGFAAVLLLLSALTPLVFYRRWWTRFFSLRTQGGARAVTSQSHKLAGLWSFWFVALIALTGVWYTIEQVMIDAAGVTWIYPEPPAFEGPTQPRLPLSTFLEAAQTLQPALRIQKVGVTGNGLVYVDGQAGDLLVRDRANTLFFAPTTASLVAQRQPATLHAAQRWVETVDLLHFGTLGGLSTKVLWFFLGLVCCGLSLTGAYLHARRLAAAGGARARWQGVGAATLATVLLFAFTVRGGYQYVLGYGPVLDGVQQMPAVPGPVLAFLWAWAALTLVLVAIWMAWIVRVPTARNADSVRPVRIRSPARSRATDPLH